MKLQPLVEIGQFQVSRHHLAARWVWSRGGAVVVSSTRSFEVHLGHTKVEFLLLAQKALV